MMGWLREWLGGMIAAAMVLTILYALVPKGVLRSVAHLAGGLVLLVVILRPLLGFDVESLRWRYDDWQEAIDEQIAVYNEDNQQQMEAIIEEETGAYISKKAQALGLQCHAQVQTELREGVPFPCAVALDLPYHRDLALWMTEELGIPEDRQQWEVET